MNDKIKYDIQPIEKAIPGSMMRIAYEQMKHDVMGVHEPFLVQSPSERVLLGLWSAYRESLLAQGHVSRKLKETITVAVSDMNRCPWCFEAHSISLQATGAASTVNAITNPDATARIDDETAALLKWVRATRTPDAAIIRNPPFSAQAAPEIIGTTVIYHYMTRMVNILLIESPLPEKQWTKAVFKRVAGVIFMPYVRKHILAGETLQFLQDALLPPDMIWAAGNPGIAGAYARFAAVIEQIADHTIPPEVRRVVENYIHTWHGEDPGMSRRWVDDVIASLDNEAKPIAKLALLGAISPHHVDDGIIQDFRAITPEDEQLIEVLAWACFTVARRIGSWLCVPAD